MIFIRRYSDFFGGTVPWYGCCLGIAVAAMGLWLYRGLERDFHHDSLENAVLVSFPLALCTGIFGTVFADAVFRGTWRTWLDGEIKQVGFVFFGWAMGALAFWHVWGRISGVGGKRLLDFFAPSLALAQAFGRIGCFLGGCCYGRPVEHFGVHYPPGSLPYEELGDVALFPVQLLESASLFALFGLCVGVPKRFRCAVYLVGVGIVRFALEYLRYDNRGAIFGQSVISPSQGISILWTVCGIALFVRSVGWKTTRRTSGVRA